MKESLPKLDRYLAFLPGTRVLDVDRGPGRVKKLDLLLDKITGDFDPTYLSKAIRESKKQ